MRPFLRRDLAARLASGAVALVIIIGLSWLGVSALTRIDSEGARSLRVSVGLEHMAAVCGGHDGQPACTYDDDEQARIERAHAAQRRIRVAVLHELRERLDAQLTALDEASEDLHRALVNADPSPQLGDAHVLAPMVDLRPAVSRELNNASRERLVEAIDEGFAVDLLAAIADRRGHLDDARTTVDQLLERDATAAAELVAIPRAHAGLADMVADADGDGGLARWLERAGTASQTPAAIGGLVRYHTAALSTAVADPNAAIWHGGFNDAVAREQAIELPSVRYRSPITDATHWRLLGTAFFGFASVLLLLVGPVTTAAQTASERQAGTLPVLRMTGLSAADLAWAMAIGPNVFAWVGGGGLLLVGTGVLALTAGPAAAALPLGLLALALLTTYPLAIGFGDALGQRLSPLVVGGLLGLVLAGGAFVGGMMVSFDALGLGFFLGPLPAVVGATANLTGFQGFAWGPAGMHGATATASLAYAAFLQVALAVICLRTWTRRVERAWEPLLTPGEGVALALASIGASLITLLDIASRSGAQSLEELNVATFVSMGLLLPVLGWLIVASLRRPARANAVAGHVAARWAFARFQGVLAIAAATTAVAYAVLMESAGLPAAGAEVMWATLAQVLLLAETAAAVVLCVARRREGKHRVALLGGLALVLQAIAVIAVYQLEAAYVVRSATAGFWAIAEGTSPYWLAFLALLWGTGLAIVFTALLRERDRKQAAADQPERNVDHDDDGMPGRRLIH